MGRDHTICLRREDISETIKLWQEEKGRRRRYMSREHSSTFRLPSPLWWLNHKQRSWPKGELVPPFQATWHQPTLPVQPGKAENFIDRSKPSNTKWNLKRERPRFKIWQLNFPRLVLSGAPTNTLTTIKTHAADQGAELMKREVAQKTHLTKLAMAPVSTKIVAAIRTPPNFLKDNRTKMCPPTKQSNQMCTVLIGNSTVAHADLLSSLKGS